MIEEELLENKKGSIDVVKNPELVREINTKYGSLEDPMLKTLFRIFISRLTERAMLVARTELYYQKHKKVLLGNDNGVPGILNDEFSEGIDIYNSVDNIIEHGDIRMELAIDEHKVTLEFIRDVLDRLLELQGVPDKTELPGGDEEYG